MKTYLEQLEPRWAPAICVPDAPLGEDAHTGAIDDFADVLSLESGPVEVCAHIDRDADTDTFRFVATDAFLEVVAEGDIPLVLGLLDQSGNQLASSPRAHIPSETSSSQSLEISTTPGNRYYLIVHSTKGQRGAYQFQLGPPDASAKTADLNNDGQVDFADFLVLSANFGKRQDAVFADGDIDGDLDVDFQDFLVLSQSFGIPV